MIRSLGLARKRVLIGAGMLAFGPVSVSAKPAPAPHFDAPHFDPVAFFTGATEGQGRLKVMLSRGKAMHVSGHGAVEPDGTLVLDQTVTTAGEKDRTRRWRIRRITPDHYVGTLTDATGPVRIDVAGNRLRIRYHAKGGLAFGQVITLEPGGQVAHNAMNVRKLGMVVATIRETITRR